MAGAAQKVRQAAHHLRAVQPPDKKRRMKAGFRQALAENVAETRVFSSDLTPVKVPPTRCL